MKHILFCLFGLSLCYAVEIGSFAEAQKLSLATNKLIVVDFYASWCGPCKKMDRDTWNDNEVLSLLDNFIFVKVDIDENKDLAKKYDIVSIPNIFIMDGLGASLANFNNYLSPTDLTKAIEKFAISTEMISMELINQYKIPCYSNSIRLFYRYCEYSMYVDDNLKSEIFKVCDHYLSQTRDYISKKEDDYKIKSKRVDLLKLYRLAYQFQFDKLERKLSEINEIDFLENNFKDLYFLKYIVSMALKKQDLSLLEDKIKTIDGFDYFKNKANVLLARFEAKI